MPITISNTMKALAAGVAVGTLSLSSWGVAGAATTGGSAPSGQRIATAERGFDCASAGKTTQFEQRLTKELSRHKARLATLEANESKAQKAGHKDRSAVWARDVKRNEHQTRAIQKELTGRQHFLTKVAAAKCNGTTPKQAPKATPAPAAVPPTTAPATTPPTTAPATTAPTTAPATTAPTTPATTPGTTGAPASSTTTS